MQLRTTGASKGALDRIVANLRASGRVRWKGKKVTQEAVLNAVWLWLEDQDPVEVERVFAVWVPRLEAMMSGADPAGFDRSRSPRVMMAPETIEHPTTGPMEVADEAPQPRRERQGDKAG